jgi:hypothetical protein
MRITENINSAELRREIQLVGQPVKDGISPGSAAVSAFGRTLQTWDMRHFFIFFDKK